MENSGAFINAIEVCILARGYNMFKIEIKEHHIDGTEATKQKSFRNEKDMYQYLIFDMLETTLDNAREDLDNDAFTSLCLQICGFMAEYFT